MTEGVNWFIFLSDVSVKCSDHRKKVLLTEALREGERHERKGKGCMSFSNFQFGTGAKVTSHYSSRRRRRGDS